MYNTYDNWGKQWDSLFICLLYDYVLYVIGSLVSETNLVTAALSKLRFLELFIYNYHPNNTLKCIRSFLILGRN